MTLSTGHCHSCALAIFLALTGCGAGHSSAGSSAGADSGGGPSSTGGAGGATTSSGGATTSTGGSASGGRSTGGSATGGSATGGQGTGGIASGTGGAPHVVTPCHNAGGAELPRGSWDNITPSQVDLSSSGTLAFAIDPVDSTILYVGTNKRGIFKTTDCGAIWTKLDTGQNSAQMDQGANNHLLVDPSNTGVLYTTAGYGGPMGVFKSTNGGVDWKQILSSEVTAAFYAGGFIESLSMDPTDPKHLITSTHGPCSGTYAPGCVAESTDAGATWKVLGGAPTWVETQNLQVMDHHTWLIGAIWGDDRTWLTTDAGGSWKKVGDRVGAAFYQETNGTIYAAGPGGGAKSTDKGLTWTDMPNSPISSVITGDGSHIYTAFGNAGSYWTAPESNTSSWTHLTTPSMAAGPCLPSFVYDRDHAILYSTNCNGGLWRATIP